MVDDIKQLVGIALLMMFVQVGFAGSRPNVIIMLADDLGWADVGYHSGDIETPSLVENIYFRNSLITDKPVYLYDRDKRSFIALNYMKKRNSIQLYSNILNDLLPGDLFIEHSIKTSESLINSTSFL